MQRYLLMGVAYAGGSDFGGVRRFNSVTIRFQAASDEEAQKTVTEQYAYIVNKVLWREVPAS
jgi:hypothetical protein